ncbi:MAG TPA: M15 family metallopeptidase [Pyrinomonadaceae bacterium]|nr:M15 family metallopeptidase [Pyrinomonadaceae bacterium]
MSTALFSDDVIFLQRLLKSAGLYTDIIDGDWGPNTDAAVTAFETRSAQIAGSIGTFDPRTERNIQTLHLRAQEAARRFMNAVDGELGNNITVRIISGTRTYAEQNELFRKGRFGNPPPRVTNARGGQSNHNFGIAWDIGIFRAGAYLPDSPLYDTAAQIAMAAGIIGLEWGGNWTSFRDRPHYQMATNLSITEVRDRFEDGQPYLT